MNVTIRHWRTEHGDTVEVYSATDGYRFRVKAANGEVVATGSEAYTRVNAALKAARRHHRVVGDEA